MSTDTIGSGRTDLATLRACLERYVARLRTELEAVQGATSSPPDTPPCTGDQAVTLAEHPQPSSALARDVLDVLTQCDLRQAAEHRHGWCYQCGQPLSAARLHILPRATLCQACEQD